MIIRLLCFGLLWSSSQTEGGLAAESGGGSGLPVPGAAMCPDGYRDRHRGLTDLRTGRGTGSLSHSSRHFNQK